MNRERHDAGFERGWVCSRWLWSQRSRPPPPARGSAAGRVLPSRGLAEERADGAPLPHSRRERARGDGAGRSSVLASGSAARDEKRYRRGNGRVCRAGHAAAIIRRHALSTAEVWGGPGGGGGERTHQCTLWGVEWTATVQLIANESHFCHVATCHLPRSRSIKQDVLIAADRTLTDADVDLSGGQRAT